MSNNNNNNDRSIFDHSNGDYDDTDDRRSHSSNIFGDEYENNEFVNEMNAVNVSHSRSKSNNPFLDSEAINNSTTINNTDISNDNNNTNEDFDAFQSENDDHSSFQHSKNNKNNYNFNTSSNNNNNNNGGYRGYFNNNARASGIDRYPSLINNGNNNFSKPGNLSSDSPNNSSSSLNSNDDLVLNPLHDTSLASGLNNGDEDFSPFGGYPASSFPLLMDEKEDDDYLHNPDPEEEARLDKRRFSLDFKHMDKKSFGGWAALVFLFLGIIAVFVVLPVLTYSNVIDYGTSATVIDLLSPYQYPQLSAIRTSLIDPDTPSSAKTKTSTSGDTWELVFSDEFNANGRTFYSGDDQFWEAPDIHYQATQDLEWYSPDAVIVANGTLTLRMDAYENHNLFYRSGMVQSWNKLCFTQGRIEISANLPNYGAVTGLWPGLWTMGNLGRPGFMSTTDGVWPYSYEACDVGITPNQSSPDGISYLPGQKLCSCTCSGEDHPNAGTGRGAPEIDILEAETDTSIGGGVGLASQSYQVAPFDIWYMPDYSYAEIYNFSTTTMNTYAGGPFQQAVSAVTTLNNNWYQFGEDAGQFQVYGYEYLNDDQTGYVTWIVGDDPTWTVNASMLIPDAVSITCDPDDYPTYDYIADHEAAYYNANMTSWTAAGYTWPKNNLTGNCTV
ncbi:beta-glucan synthesis-associated protein [Hanseniaspora valbyensis]